MRVRTGRDTLDFVRLALTHDSVEMVRAVFDHVKRQSVVDIRQVRRLQKLLDDLKGRNLVALLGVEVDIMNRWLFLYFGKQVLHFIALYRPPGARSRNETIRRIAGEVAANPYFRKLNQRARRYYAEFAPVPYGEVQDHYREGYRVSGHIRLFGNQHLLELPHRTYPEFVGRVVHVLVNMRKYRIRPEG